MKPTEFKVKFWAPGRVAIGEIDAADDYSTIDGRLDIATVFIVGITG